jgi:aryl-alcohol dehydrogenase-like predicted oxidoreductase
MAEWQRTLGRSGLPVTAIGLGLAALGRPGYLTLGHGQDLGADRSVEAMERQAHEVLDFAYGAGVRYFDAARSYGRAEAFLASWLASRDVAVTVGSKWGYTYTAGWEVDADPPEVKDLSSEAFRRQVAETRQLLGDRLDLYQIHSATVQSGVLEDPDVLEGLAELRGQGVAVGLTATGADQAATIEQAVAAGAFDTVQATFNVLEPSAGPALERAHAAGLGVVVKEALANGRLTPRAAPPALATAAEALGTGADAVALAAVLAQPFADVVLSGAATADTLRSNLAAAELDPDPGTLAALEGLAEPPDRYWAARGGLAWN